MCWMRTDVDMHGSAATYGIQYYETDKRTCVGECDAFQILGMMAREQEQHGGHQKERIER